MIKFILLYFILACVSSGCVAIISHISGISHDFRAGTALALAIFALIEIYKIQEKIKKD